MDNEQLGGGTIAAITLGAIFLVIVTATVVVCFLIKKGNIRNETSPAQGKALPGLMSLRSRISSFRSASERSKNAEPTPIQDDSGPIIYLYDDIYRPPRSLALPDQFPEDKRKSRKSAKAPKPTPPSPQRQRAEPPAQIPPHAHDRKDMEEDVIVVPDTSKGYKMIGAGTHPQVHDCGYIRTYD